MQPWHKMTYYSITRSTELDTISLGHALNHISRKELTSDLIPKLDWKSVEAIHMILQESYLSRIGKPNILKPQLLVSKNAGFRSAFTWSCKCHCTRDA